jgi:hypothetical protein
LGLHEDYNRAIAYGDKRWLAEGACRGVQKEASALIDRRELAAKHNEQGPPAFDWSIQKYTKSIFGGLVPPFPATCLPVYSYRVLGDMVGAVPVGKDVMLRQTVVRISSRQQLHSREGTMIQDVTEYVVMQKTYWNGKEEPWMYWGTVEPLTPEGFKEELNKKSEDGEESVMERIRNAMATQTPSSS